MFAQVQTVFVVRVGVVQMENLAEMLAELRVVFAQILEDGGTGTKPVPQIEAPSCTFPEDQDGNTAH